MRLKIIRIGIIGLFLIIVLELFYLQVIQGRYYYALSRNNRIRVVPLEGWRGRILDRNGKVLADNRISFNAAITPQEINGREQELFWFLAAVFNVPQEGLLKKYNQRKVTPFTPVLLAEDISRNQAMVIEENSYRFPSLTVQESFKRFYPMGCAGAHLLGYVGKINQSIMEELKEYGYSPETVVGYSGVEEFYDGDLRGSMGGVQIEVNHPGEEVRILSLKEPTKGQDIQLTVDTELEHMTQELLEGRSGAIIVMDMENGGILGMASSPAYDPNVFVDNENRERIRGLFSHPQSPLLNRAIQGLFPPGSVFKIPVSICALDTKKITFEKSFYCPGYYELGATKFRCTHAHGTQNLIGAIAYSCNVYYYNVGLMIGEENIYHYAKKLGLGSLANIDLPFEERGYISSRQQRLLKTGKRWYPGDTLNLSIGQGDTLTTPLQLVKMMTTIAQGGEEVQPHLIQEIGSHLVEKYSLKRSVLIDKKVFEPVQKGLRAAVAEDSGTAHVLDIPGVYIAGKTGTVQTAKTGNDHAWFVGYTRNTKKEIAFCVFLEHGGSSYNACLVAKDLLLQLQKKGIL